jgi:hypothetical protein
MSHYCVGVIVEDIDNFEAEIEEILAPYDENLEVKPYLYKTKAQLIEEAKQLVPIIKKHIEEDPKYQIVNTYREKILAAVTDEDFYQAMYDEDCEYDEEGNQLTTYNPNSKWDWYQIGGRFRHEEDSVQIKNFKLYDEMDEETKRKYHQVWENFLIGVKNPEELEKDVFGDFRLWKDQYYIDRYGTCDNWIKQVNSNIPYAFVDKNGWYEKGKMGWFGCDDATKESIEDYTAFAEAYFADPANQEKYIVWVDCHI